MEIHIGKGNWAGKAVGAAAAVTTGFLPAYWPVYIMMALQAGSVGCNTMKQLSLPEKVDNYIYNFLEKQM